MSIQCFRLTWNEILNQTGKDSTCGNLNSTTPIVPCCANGDTRLANGLCSYQKSLVGGSGYYVAGCTASSGLCPGFPNRCTSQFLPDVTWNSTSGLWQCCGVDADSNPVCDDPTNEQFVAPAPGTLQTVFSIAHDGWKATSTALLSANTSVSTFPSTTTDVSVVDFKTTTAASDATSTPSTSPSDLSSGTKAGIGIGAALAILSVIGLVAYLIIRKRGRRLCTEQHVEPLEKGDSITALHELQDRSPVLHEVENNGQLPVEIENQIFRHELEARR